MALAFWNGAYNGTSSNLLYSANGEIIGSNNISSQSVKYATNADNADNLAGHPVSDFVRSVNGINADASGNISNFSNGIVVNGYTITVE